MKSKIMSVLEPQKKLFKEFVAELEGKTMDCESCELLKQMYDRCIENIVNAFIQCIEELKRRK